MIKWRFFKWQVCWSYLGRLFTITSLVVILCYNIHYYEFDCLILVDYLQLRVSLFYLGIIFTITSLLVYILLDYLQLGVCLSYLTVIFVTSSFVSCSNSCVPAFVLISFVFPQWQINGVYFRSKSLIGFL